MSSAWRTGFPSSRRISGYDRLHLQMYFFPRCQHSSVRVTSRFIRSEQTSAAPRAIGNDLRYGTRVLLVKHYFST